jgi:BirA family transcriptional regulator, biotin operon repressor / biotin---[acetyl-CoA-carboxylase] ligase
VTALGRPRLHLRETDSTNERARALALEGAPHGTLVTASAQTAGRGRQGRRWEAAPGSALLCSLVLRHVDDLLSLRAGLAVADVAGEAAQVKWPNDVLVAGRKVAGVLVEARPQDGWAALGIGVNLGAAPPALGERAGALGRTDTEAALGELLAALEARLAEPAAAALEALRERDALLGERVEWADGAGVGAGIDDAGGLRVRLESGEHVVLSAGEVHLAARLR